MLVRYLRKRGWVVFWLDEIARKCRGECWLAIYEQERLRDEIKEIEKDLPYALRDADRRQR